jgi:hypothetical protein
MQVLVPIDEKVRSEATCSVLVLEEVGLNAQDRAGQDTVRLNVKGAMTGARYQANSQFVVRGSVRLIVGCWTPQVNQGER